MSFRTKLLAFFTTTVIAAVALVAWGAAFYTRRAFQQFDNDRTAALIAQFRREYIQQGDDIALRVQNIADAEATLRMAMDLNRPGADASQYYNDARALARSEQLDFLDIIDDDGSVISSAEWPAKVNYKTDWVAGEADWNSQGPFLRRVELADSVELGLIAIRVVLVGEKRLYIAGGQRVNSDFMSSLILPSGMRALLYRNLEADFAPADLSGASGVPAVAGQADRFAPMIADVQRSRAEITRTIRWGSDAAGTETFEAVPLNGRQNDLLAVLLVGSSRRGLVSTLSMIRSLALLAGGGVVLFALILGWWLSARLTRPIERLAAGAKEVAAGHWNTRVDVRSRDEIGQLAGTFNDMTAQLAEQRESLVQMERVAAWRELARCLAHELKNPLFPLQLTVETLTHAREQTSEQFDEIFFESTATLRAELQNLKEIVGRFSDFAKMPPPELEPVDLNELVRGVVKSFEPQFSALGRPPVTSESYLDENLPHLHADPALLRRAIENLVLNALDAMPAGGILTARTSYHNGNVRLEVRDTGAGLTPEECSRLFAPYYAAKQRGTGLGLAIVQSVVSDHGGRTSVESVPGAGATFRIELPIGMAPIAKEDFTSEIASTAPRLPSESNNRPNDRCAPAAKPNDPHADKIELDRPMQEPQDDRQAQGPQESDREISEADDLAAADRQNGGQQPPLPVSEHNTVA